MNSPFSLSQKKSQTTSSASAENEDEPESFHTGEQTRFAEDIPLIVEPRYDEEKVVQEPKKPSKFTLILVVGLPLVLILFVVTLLASRRQSRVVVPTPSPVASGSARIKGEIERRLDLVEQDIQKADPLQPELAFPPINFELNLEDATLRKARATQRR